jgi:hypothetical protein
MGVNVELSIGCAKRTPQAIQSISNKQCNERKIQRFICSLCQSIWQFCKLYKICCFR